MTRAEHLAWAKRRALEYVERGELMHAVSSMMSDLAKHPELGSPGADMACLAGILQIGRGREAVRRWIEGFN